VSHPSERAADAPVLRSISPEATPEEVAAIVAAIESAAAISGAALDGPAETDGGETLNEWTRGSRLGARRAGLQRGPWRLSGRIGRRSRA
jgi:hypothetical protein